MNSLASDVNAERMILGTILLDDSVYPSLAGGLTPGDFSLEKHGRIFRRMVDLAGRGERIDRITVYGELLKHDEAESCDGLSYLVELDNGLPQLPNVDSYVRIVRDKATLRQISEAGNHLCHLAMQPDAEPTELLARATAQFLGIAERSVETTLAPPLTIIEEAGGLNAYLDRRNRRAGLESGYRQFDTISGGFRQGALYILGARPRMGKTAWALNVAERVSINQDAVTVIFSLEMGRESLLDRLICSRARVDTKRFEGGFLNREERDRLARATADLADSGRVLIDDRAITTTQEIHAKIRKQQGRGPVGLVVLDYLQLLIEGQAKYRVAEASKISRDLKLIAKDCKVPILALSQLNRECDTRDNHEPTLSDLRETGALEQDADLVAFLFRQDVYRKDPTTHDHLADLIIAKQRSGPEGRVPLVWLKQFTRFEERAEELPYAED